VVTINLGYYMPKMTAGQIEFLPEDRQAISEQSPGITPTTYTSLFNGAIADGDTTHYFKFLEEIHEKDPDIMHTIETRTSYVTSKEWQVEDEDGEAEGDEAMRIDAALRSIPGDPTQGLLTLDKFIASLLGSSYLTGLSFSEIVADEKEIVGFNHIPCHFLTFRDAVSYPKLWTQDTQMGVEFNKDKMISHYLSSDTDPARGYLGNAVAWQYVFKRANLDERVRFEKKYGKGFLQVNMPGERDTFIKDWEIAEELIENLDDVDGVTFGAQVEVDYHETMQAEGDYFFNAEESFKSNITRIILGQESTSSVQDSNRSTASVHMEVLEQRTLDDMASIEETINRQLLPKIKQLLGIGESSAYQFKFVISDLEATLDEDIDEEGAVEDDTEGQTVETPAEDEDNG